MIEMFIADPDWTLVKRVAAQLQSVPVTIQQSANCFQCTDRDTDPGLMGWLSDAATKTIGSKPVQSGSQAAAERGIHTQQSV